MSAGKRPGWRRWITGIAVVVIVIGALDRVFPPPIPRLDTDRSTVVLARDGSPLRAFAASNGVWRYPVQVADVSPRYLEALLGYEDRWFYRHPGVNPLALLRAIGQALRQGEVVSGGSTLTMQVARLLEPIPRSPWGKLIQMLRAVQLELRLNKAQILALYLARAPFGGTIEGVEAAAWSYLGKSSRQLSHAEAALLAVLPQAPSRLRPDRHPELARQARDKVLERLRAQGVWPDGVLAGAALEPVIAQRVRPPLAAALLAERLRRAYPAETVLTTTIDAQLQRTFERRLPALIRHLPPLTSAAALLVDNATLEARVYLGSADFADDARLGQVDMIRAIRSPGSTLKPFLYGLALDDGLIHAASLLSDAPTGFDGYRPANFGDVFSGPVSAADALRRSLNVPAVDLLARVTPERFMARLAHGGVRLTLPRGARPHLALILGGTGVRMEALASGYAAFANAGVMRPVRYLVDPPAGAASGAWDEVPPSPATGHAVDAGDGSPLDGRRLLSQGAAFIVTDMLQGAALPMNAALSAATAPKLAWKTGTSYGYRDAWAFGVTKTWTLGVWVGRPDGTPMPGQYGAATALPVLFSLLSALPHPPGDRQSPAPPDGVTRQAICWPTGRAMDSEDPSACQEVTDTWILRGNVPPTLVPSPRGAGQGNELVKHVLVDTRSGKRVTPACAHGDTRPIAIAQWPLPVAAWLSASRRRASRLPAWAAGCAPPSEQSGRLRIDGLADGSVLRRAPGVDTPPAVSLRVRQADGNVQWLVDGRLVAVTAAGEAFRYHFDAAGRHRILALDEEGRYDSLFLRIEG